MADSRGIGRHDTNIIYTCYYHNLRASALAVWHLTLTSTHRTALRGHGVAIDTAWSGGFVKGRHCSGAALATCPDCSCALWSQNITWLLVSLSCAHHRLVG